MGLWATATSIHAQNPKTQNPETQNRETPGLRNAHALAQKQRSGRFLARRSIGPQSAYARNAADVLAEARAQHYAMVVQRETSGGNTSLTAPWQPVGPAQVMTSAYGAVTGRVSSIAVDPSDPTGNTVYVGRPAGACGSR